MTTPTIVPLTEMPARKGETGIGYPDTVDGWRWLYRQRHERGMAAAFLRQGRRVLVDVPRYLELIRSQSAA